MAGGGVDDGLRLLPDPTSDTLFGCGGGGLSGTSLRSAMMLEVLRSVVGRAAGARDCDDDDGSCDDGWPKAEGGACVVVGVGVGVPAEGGAGARADADCGADVRGVAPP
jgi:hypothetical protein